MVVDGEMKDIERTVCVILKRFHISPHNMLKVKSDLISGSACFSDAVQVLTESIFNTR